MHLSSQSRWAGIQFILTCYDHTLQIKHRGSRRVLPLIALFWWDRRDVLSPPHPCPAGPRADGTVSGADVDNQGSQSVSRPVHSSTVPHRGFGPEWDSPDNHPSPTSSCTTQGASGLALQLGHGIPRGDAVVVLCREDVSHTACRLAFDWSVRKHLLMFNHLRQFAFYSLS